VDNAFLADMKPGTIDVNVVFPDRDADDRPAVEIQTQEWH
jgi:hypothetical protein